MTRSVHPTERLFQTIRECHVARHACVLFVSLAIVAGTSAAADNGFLRGVNQLLELPLPVTANHQPRSTIRIIPAPTPSAVNQSSHRTGKVVSNSSMSVTLPVAAQGNRPKQDLRSSDIRDANQPAAAETSRAEQRQFQPAAFVAVAAEVPAIASFSIETAEPLPPLAEELQRFGGSSLYEAEGEHAGSPFVHHGDDHVRNLRLPESWEKPLPPVTAYQEFVGADPIGSWDGLNWFGDDGFQWEPRLVAHGSYEMFGLFLEQGGTRQDAIGHQLIVDVDLQLTGTERAHVQFRPLGRRNTGGSFFRLDDPTGFDDNSTGIPDRWWIEGEFYSLFGGLIDDEFTPLDYHITVGKVPYAVHNSLLINDEVTGVIVNKNTLLIPPLSNLNIQGFYFFDDVDTATPHSTELVGMHASADWRNAFIEGTVAYVSHSDDASFDSRYAAVSATKFFGPVTLAGRALFKDGDEAGTGDGALFVVESNLTRLAPHEISCVTGIEHAVFYGNFFKATSGWSPISGANFNRLRSSFAVDPLIRIGQGLNPSDTTGASLGVQLFRDHEDESITPEVAWEQPQGDSVWGVGLRWQRKLGPQIFLDASGLISWSDNRQLEREGIFISTFVLF
tara:strand:+ start:55906 stop:57759 length:1854 start_codon:yes stop_codon:yes gene_type:complete